MTMTYRVALRHSAEGVSVLVPALPGCWSQGRDEAEALESVEDAIREYLAAVEAQLADQDVRELEVEL
jgi:predicted RNase H-like HicB family nuclease